MLGTTAEPTDWGTQPGNLFTLNHMQHFYFMVPYQYDYKFELVRHLPHQYGQHALAAELNLPIEFVHNGHQLKWAIGDIYRGLVPTDADVLLFRIKNGFPFLTPDQVKVIEDYILLENRHTPHPLCAEVKARRQVFSECGRSPPSDNA